MIAEPQSRGTPPTFSTRTLDLLREAAAVDARPSVRFPVRLSDDALSAFLDEAVRSVASSRSDLVGLDGTSEPWSRDGALLPEVAADLMRRIPSPEGGERPLLAALHADLLRRVEVGPYGGAMSWLTASPDGGIRLGTVRRDPLVIEFGERATVVE